MSSKQIYISLLCLIIIALSLNIKSLKTDEEKNGQAIETISRAKNSLEEKQTIELNNSQPKKEIYRDYKTEQKTLASAKYQPDKTLSMAKYPDCEALFYKQEFQSAIDCFDKKLGKNPEEQSDINVRYNLALTLMRYKKYDESKKEFKKLISNPNTPQNILQGSKTALNRIEENSKISVNNSTGNNRTSTLNNEYFPCQTMYSKLDYSGALACYKEKNINYKSDRKEEINALYQYSEILHYAKKYNEAKSGYMAIMSNPYADANLKKSSKEAIEEIDRRILEDKYSECTSLFEKQDYEKTLSCYNRKQTNKDFKNHEVSWYNYAVTLQKLKRYQEAKKEFEAIISSHRARFYGLMAKNRLYELEVSMKYGECENLLTKESLLSCFERKIDRNSTDEIDINARFQYINLLIANNRFNDAKKECSAIISIPGVSKQNSDYAKLMMSSIDKTLSEIKNQK